MYLDIQGTKLHYEMVGTGIPIVIIHGKSVDYRLMYGCLEPIFREESLFQRIYFDIPGMGCSIPGDNIQSWGNVVDVLLEVIELLIGEEKFMLIGESFGAHLLRGIVSKRDLKVRGVAYICPWIQGIEQTLPNREVTVFEQDVDWSADQ